MDNHLLITAALVTAALAVGLISRKYLGDDNPVEEISEEIIKEETGVDIDLSPKTPENKDANDK